jgi:hypothetical protein
VNLYSSYRNWVDGIMRDSAIRAPAPVVGTAALPILCLQLAGARHPLVWSAAFVWTGIVIIWGIWRYARVVKSEITHVDLKYEQETRRSLSKEYQSPDRDDAPKA